MDAGKPSDSGVRDFFYILVRRHISMKNLAHLLQCLLIGVTVSSCGTHLATLHLVGTKEIDSSFETGPRVVGEDCGYSIVYVPVRVATVDKAIENALQKENGDLLLDVRASQTFWGIPAVFPALYLNMCYQVSGRVAKVKPKMDPASSHENKHSQR